VAVELRRRQAHPLDPGSVVAGQAQLDAGEGGGGARGADEGNSRRHVEIVDDGECLVDGGDQRSRLVGGGRVAGEVALAEPDGSDGNADRALEGAAMADGDLGRAAADV